jgi:hypothetical protein
MGECEAIILENISGSGWTALINKVQKEYGVMANGNSGRGSKYGYSLSWNYDQTLSRLTIQCTEKPASIDCKTVNRDITNYIKAIL